MCEQAIDKKLCIHLADDSAIIFSNEKVGRMRKSGDGFGLKIWRGIVLLLMMSVMAGILFACGESDPASPVVKPKEESVKGKSAEPVTLRLYDSLFTDEEFNQLIAGPTKRKYPDITLQKMENSNGLMKDLEQLVAAGTTPDILFVPNSSLQALNQLDITMGQETMIKKANTDMSLIDPVIVKTLPLISGTGEITALPLYRNIVASFYNKNLFDRFGVAYPKDGMTYSQMIELARTMTRSESGTEYYGLFPATWNIQRGQLSQNVLDAKTGKSLVASSKAFTEIFELHYQVYQIPGMMVLTQAKARTAFFKDKNLAVLLDWAANFIKMAKQTTDINWDMVTMPVFPDHPNVHSGVDFHVALVTKTSKHPDQSYDVISFLSTSKEVQSALSKAGRIPTLKDPAILRMFGSDFLKEKNVSVLEKTNMAPIDANHFLENVGAIRQPLTAAFNNVVAGKVDVNTALREASEGIDKAVAAEMSQ
jgi:multiple sugar transport system substrate-binding protein